MYGPIDSFEFEHEGRDYIAEIHADDSSDTPWQRGDAYAEPETVRGRNYAGYVAKSPGEIVLYKGDRNGYSYLYNVAKAVRQLRKDGVSGEDAVKYVNAEVERFRSWLNNDWHYIGIVVRLAGSCSKCGASESLWGIESDCEEYIKEVARELAAELPGTVLPSKLE